MRFMPDCDERGCGHTKGATERGGGMSDCIRRDYAVWTTCRCDKCEPIARRIQKLARHGQLERTPSAQAWERVTEWLEQGFEPTWIASACGIPARGIGSAVDEWLNDGHQRDFGPHHARKIVTANIWDATEGRGPALGSRRRLQGLAWLGYSGEAISELTGISFVTLASIQRGATSRLRPGAHHAIRAAYERLENTPGPSKKSATRARNKGYLPPATWDDPDHDSPEPICGTDRGYIRHRTRKEQPCAICRRAHRRMRALERKAA
jgi:hypothetical protein